MSVIKKKDCDIWKVTKKEKIILNNIIHKIEICFLVYGNKSFTYLSVKYLFGLAYILSTYNDKLINQRSIALCYRNCELTEAALKLQEKLVKLPNAWHSSQQPIPSRSLKTQEGFL